MISSSSPEIANINGHWSLTWSLTSGLIGISRDMHMLAETPHMNNNNKKIRRIIAKT
jgi:hypothetical protein